MIVKVANCKDAFEGEVVKGMLEANGIECYLQNENMSQIYGGIQAMAINVMVKEEDALICPMLDTRRMEVYAGIYTRGLKGVRPVQADIVDDETYRDYLDEHPVYFFGNGAAKCRETISHPNARFIDGIEPLAKYMQPLAERRYVEQKYEDTAYFVPFYLKDFVAKMPKKLL